MMINRRLLALVPESKKYIVYCVLCKCLSLATNTILIFSAAWLTCEKCTSSQYKYIIPICAFSAILSVLSARYRAKNAFLASKKVKETLRSKIYKKLLSLGTAYQEKTETAKLVQITAEGVEQLETMFGAYFPQLYFSMIAAISTFAILFLISVKMALILLVCVPLIPLSIVAVQKIAKKRLSKYWDQYANLADNFLENLQGLTTLQIYQADEFKQIQMKNDAELFRKVTMKVLSMQLNSIIIMDMIAYGGAGLGIAAAINGFRNGEISLWLCFASILICADFFVPLRQLGSFFHVAMNGSAASKKIFTFLDAKETQYGNIEISKAELNNTDFKKNLYTVTNMSFSYKNRRILNDLNFTIQHGSFTAFFGESGSGKSTMAKILAGINRNYQGNVKIAGIEMKDICSDSIYKSVCYISHRDWIFKGTVKDTLKEGNPDATEKEMNSILEQLQLTDFLKEKNGLETEILENASNLSGGQKQRLSIARAILHNPEIIIFDEATSNIDVESETAIMKFLHQLKGKKTIIMISHRMENCCYADSVYEFSDRSCRMI
jgi:ATP-binding cassette subfamily C protein